jgi:hypothetical protein
MKERWLPVGILAGILFLINFAGRLAVQFWAKDNDNRQGNIGLVAFVVIGVVMVGAAWYWIRRYPTQRAWGDLLAAIGAGGLAAIFLGPLLLLSSPFHGGAGDFFRQIWVYLGLAVGGGIFGMLIVMTLGQDWKSQSWKRYTQQVGEKPRRVVRR